MEMHESPIFWHKLGTKKDLKVNEDIKYIKTFTGDIGVRVVPTNSTSCALMFYARVVHSAHFKNEASESGFGGEAESAEQLAVAYLCQDPFKSTAYESLLNDIACTYTSGGIGLHAMKNFSYAMIWWAVNAKENVRESIQEWSPSFISMLDTDLKAGEDLSPEMPH